MKTRLIATVFALSLPMVAHSTNKTPDPNQNQEQSQNQNQSQQTTNTQDSQAYGGHGGFSNLDSEIEININNNLSTDATLDNQNRLELPNAPKKPVSHSPGKSGGGDNTHVAVAGHNEQSQSTNDSANNSFDYQSYNQTIHRAGLIGDGCWGSVDAAQGRQMRMLGIAFTFRDGSCVALRNAAGALQLFPEETLFAREVLCGNKLFREADARAENKCHDNRVAKKAPAKHKEEK